MNILLKAFLLRPLGGSLSSPPSSSTGPLVARLLPRVLDRPEDETGPSQTLDDTQRDRVEQEDPRAAAEVPLSSPRLELFSRPPPGP